MTSGDRLTSARMLWVVVVFVWLWASCPGQTDRPKPEVEPRWSTAERALGPR